MALQKGRMMRCAVDTAGRCMASGDDALGWCPGSARLAPRGRSTVGKMPGVPRAARERLVGVGLQGRHLASVCEAGASGCRVWRRR